ncbi:hypothetical protein [Faecalicatena contorta]|uniref:Uncharacterized protein n=1 Tax=Faecalicatena contorta TaxID=39482 RepID=A0A316A0J9_9FIRM|nr:hypothetical protein [Faecalicatena contorta]PWJ51113.1 hypothetical protein A8805_103414 [Faecalicatena contorta]SUQ13681.1 hypothetical protein SAMN05216529_103414 [Faecalicatena contorta]
MESFDIPIHGKSVNSKDIHSFVIKGQINKAVEFVVDKTHCSIHEAKEVVDEIRNLSLKKRDEKLETWKTKAPGQCTKVIDKNKEYLLQKAINNIPHCPRCESTNIQRQKVRIKGSLQVDGLKPFRCSRCGYEW